MGGIVTVAVILLAVYFLVQSADSRGDSVSIRADSGGAGVAARPGMEAPNFSLPTLGNTVFELSNYRGQPVWINFWATWCPPCRAEMRDIQSLQGRLEEDGVAFIAVNFGEDPAEVARYIATAGFTFPVGLDLDKAVVERYRVLALPTHIFIDRYGVVHKIRVGSVTRQEMQQILDKLTKKGG